jgi:hypothetical protein
MIIGENFFEKSFPDLRKQVGAEPPFKKLQTNKKAKYVQAFFADLHDTVFHLFV